MEKGISRDAVLDQLERLLASPAFQRSDRLSRFLRYTVERSLDGRACELKEYTVGIEVFDRGDDFDPRTVSVVRTQAGRLRTLLAEYYESQGRLDPILIEFPKGVYAPVFSLRQREPRPGRKIAIAIAAAALLVMAIAGWLVVRGRGEARISSIAVLPFVNLGPNPDDAYLGDGMAEELIDALTRIDGLAVTARTSAFAFRGKPADIRDIGKKLNVAAVVEGSVRRSGDGLRVTAQLNRASDGYHLWSQSYDVSSKDFLSVQREITAAIVSAMKPRLQSPGARTNTRSAETDLQAEAHELCLRARYLVMENRARAMEQALAVYQQALAKSPDYAPAYSGLATLYVRQGTRGLEHPSVARSKAQAAAGRALALDGTLAEAHISAAMVKCDYDWNWTEAEREFRRAIELNPGSMDARRLYGRFLFLHGRKEASLRELQLARRLDPLSVAARTMLGEAHFFLRSFDDGLAECSRALAEFPQHPSLYVCMALNAAGKRDFDHSVRSFQDAMNLFGNEPTMDFLGALGYAHAAAGHRDEAMRLLERLQNESKRRYISPMVLARVYAGLADKDRVLDQLERGCDLHDPLMMWMKADVRFDFIRGEARYRRVLQRMGLS